MTSPLRILIVDDSPEDATLLAINLRRSHPDLDFARVENAEEMRAALDGPAWDVVLCDWSMPRFSALGALELLERTGLDVPFIIVSGTISEETAVHAMRAGAHDYVLKDKLSRLAPAIERELRETKVRRALQATENQLRHAQKVEAVGRLAGGIAHDFNNVLSVILSYSDLLLTDLAPKDPMRPNIEEIRTAGRQGADLTRQLLAFSRQQTMEPRVVDLNEVVMSTEKMLRRILGEDVDLVLTCASRKPRIRVDPGNLDQVLMNLVVNARDAMPAGGKLTIETTDVVLGEEFAREHVGVCPGPHVLLAVTDTGVGMDPAMQARIFEPFFTTKETGKGTGLGLSTVFGIVQRSGGTVWVYSEPGMGTTFKVYLPRVDAPVESIRTSLDSAPPRGTETILLVEDEDQVRLVILGILRRYGYRVLEARSAGEALLLCQTTTDPIRLLLSDVVMPHMSGPELATRLGATRPEMRVLCMSGYTDDSIARHGVLGSEIPFLQKPITPNTLTRKVRDVLDAATSPVALGGEPTIP